MDKQPKADRSILIVEDEPVTRAAMTHLLAHFGYRTTSAGTVAEGLAKLDGQAFAILDINLPDGPVTTILARIRSENRGTKVVVATGTNDSALSSEIKAHQPDLFLRKPIDLNALLKWLAEAG